MPTLSEQNRDVAQKRVNYSLKDFVGRDWG